MPKAHGGDVLSGEMNPDKVMEDPVDIEALLEALFLFRPVQLKLGSLYRFAVAMCCKCCILCWGFYSTTRCSRDASLSSPMVKGLQNAIKRFFAWHPRVVGLLLDGYHLVKKFNEALSLACRGRVLRNQHLRALLRVLGMASWLRRSTI
jgi:hypothetical protein